MKPRIASIGTFDGVHRGHLSVIKELLDKAEANGMEPLVITFDKHPLALLRPHNKPMSLSTNEEKRNLLKEHGLEPLVVEFDQNLQSTSARSWMKELHDKYNVRALVVGYDNTFGSDGINLSLDDYRKLGAQEGIEVYTADIVKGISSSAIRKAVAEGDLDKVNEMLGRPYTITGTVVEGERLGRKIGFPTANLDVPAEKALPKSGVYAALVTIPGSEKSMPAMVNIGTRPTVTPDDKTSIEVHLLDRDDDLYGKELSVAFLQRLRDEKRFDSLEELKQQLEIDKIETSKLIKSTT